MKNNLSIKKLKGIKPKGVKIKPGSGLEIMFNMYNYVMSNYDLNPEYHTGHWNNLYKTIQNIIEPGLIKSNLKINDLCSFIDALEHEEPPENLKLRGLYTGCILDILTKKYREKNEPCRVYINGLNKTGEKKFFPYLFYQAINVDELIVENINGDCICSHIGAHSGNAKLVIARNIKGTSTLSYAGAEKGKAGIVFGQNLSGTALLIGCGSKNGEVDALIGSEHSSFGSFEAVGMMGGHVKLVVANNVFDLNAFSSFLMLNGVADHVFIKDCLSEKINDLIDEYGGGIGFSCIDNEEGKRYVFELDRKQEVFVPKKKEVVICRKKYSKKTKLQMS